jgi:putative tryptophan/tyrosine transport system substrate-binding protein
MRRREFIGLIGGAAATSSIRALAQQPNGVRRIGFLLGLSENDPEARTRIAALRQGLATTGWMETHNIRIEYRFAGGDAERVRAYAAELVALAPDVIVAQSTPVVAALKRATSTIPIVFVAVNDPVGQGLFKSLARPGGNITGFSFIEFEMIGKCLGLLKEIAPGVTRASLMFDPDLAPYFSIYLRQIGATPGRLAVELTEAPVRDTSEIEANIAKLGSGDGLIVGPDPFTVVNRGVIIRSAERQRLPAIFTLRQDAVEGALMSYGPDTADMFRRSASYVDRILKGAKPDELPVQAPTKFELVINLKTAKALGLDVPLQLQQRADEVIE